MTTNGLEVLVVDDNGMNRKIFSMVLSKMGNSVEEAPGGMECLDLVCRKKYDVIFLDHMMPAPDGVETLKQMKVLETSLNMQTPVIALTANDMQNGESFYLEAGFDGYLEKPVPPQKLEEFIKEL